MRRGYLTLWKTFIQPRRMAYSVKEMLLAYDTDNQFHLKLSEFKVKNPYNDQLICFRYQNLTKITKKLMIYAHTHSGSSLEGTPLLNILVEEGFDFVCFDFCGNGKSSAPFVTLGFKEKDDLLSVITHCKEKFGYSEIYLWGRSMGAAAILLMLAKYQAVQQMIRGVVVDSPFLNLRKLCVHLATQRTPLPKLIIEGGLNIVRGTIMDKAQFDIDTINPVDGVDRIGVPGVFIIANDDELVPPAKFKEMFNRYKSKYKKFIMMKGSHASIRKDNDIKQALTQVISLSQEKQGAFGGGDHPKRKESDLPIVIETKINSILCVESFNVPIKSHERAKNTMPSKKNEGKNTRPASLQKENEKAKKPPENQPKSHFMNFNEEKVEKKKRMNFLPPSGQKEETTLDERERKTRKRKQIFDRPVTKEINPSIQPSKLPKDFKDPSEFFPSPLEHVFFTPQHHPSKETPNWGDVKREELEEKKEEIEEDIEDEPMITYEFEKKQIKNMKVSDIFFQVEDEEEPKAICNFNQFLHEENNKEKWHEDAKKELSTSPIKNEAGNGPGDSRSLYFEENKAGRVERMVKISKGNYEDLKSPFEISRIPSGNVNNPFENVRNINERVNSPFERVRSPNEALWSHHEGVRTHYEDMRSPNVPNSNQPLEKQWNHHEEMTRSGQKDDRIFSKRSASIGMGKGRQRGISITRATNGQVIVDEGVVLNFREKPSQYEKSPPQFPRHNHYH